MRRSQAILRLPVDSVLATLTLHDGERSDVLLFLPPGETITSLVSPGDPFLPMIRNARFCLVARDAVAALGVVTGPAVPDDAALPTEHQRARIRLRSGTVLDGELRWTATEGERRTADCVNDAAPFLVLHAIETQTTYYIPKAQVALVEEVG
jgi:hypothetical protein